MIEYLEKLYNLFASEDLVLIFISIFIGLIIGWEREYRNKSAGLRTLMLVCVGSCTFTILSLRIGVENPDRLAANIITGIGFLGAGAIFKDENKVNGITTACTIWVVAALGMSIGSGHIYLAIISASVVFFVLWSLIALEKLIDKAHKIRDYKITSVYDNKIFERYEKIFDEYGLKHIKLSLVRTDEKISITWRLSGNQKNHKKLSTYLLDDTSINRVEF